MYTFIKTYVPIIGTTRWVMDKARLIASHNWFVGKAEELFIFMTNRGRYIIMGWKISESYIGECVIQLNLAFFWWGLIKPNSHMHICITRFIFIRPFEKRTYYAVAMSVRLSIRNIPHGAAYGFYISQVIRYSRVCNGADDFKERVKLLTNKLIKRDSQSIAWKYYEEMPWEA